MSIGLLIPFIPTYKQIEKDEKTFGAELHNEGCFQTTKVMKKTPPRNVKKGFSIGASIIPSPFRNLEAESLKRKIFFDKVADYVKNFPNMNMSEIRKIPELQQLEETTFEPVLIDLSQRVIYKKMLELTDYLKDKVETNFQLFFGLELLLEGTKKKYQLNHTKNQIGQGKVYYPAAHCASITSLMYNEGGSWIDFAKGTTISNNLNVTMILARESNDVDGCIEGANTRDYKDIKLRKIAVEILNSLAEDEKPDLKKGFEKYVHHYADLAAKAQKKYQNEYAKESKIRSSEEKQKIEHKLYTLKCYLEVAHTYKVLLSKDDNILKKMCFVGKVSDLSLTDCIKKSEAKADLKKELDAIKMQQGPKKANIGPITRSKSKIASSSQNNFGQIKPAQGNLEPFLKDLSVTAKKYKDLCLKSEAVKNVAIEYFTSGKLESIKLKVKTVVIDVIRAKYVKIKIEPQNTPSIVEHVLKEIYADYVKKEK